jgi:hypothetical protein
MASNAEGILYIITPGSVRKLVGLGAEYIPDLSLVT